MKAEKLHKETWDELQDIGDRELMTVQETENSLKIFHFLLLLCMALAGFFFWWLLLSMAIKRKLTGNKS